MATTDPRPMSAEEKKVIFASSLGTVFEWYDFYLYGSLAAIIAKQFFSGLDEGSAFIFALLAFAAGFSSEMFLMAVRGVVERMIHGGTRKVSADTQYQLPATKPAEVVQPVDTPPNPTLQIHSLSLVPLQNNQKVKFVRVKQLPDGTIIELLTAGAIKKIAGNNITVSCEIKGKPVDVVVARGDIAPAEQVGTQQDDLKG